MQRQRNKISMAGGHDSSGCVSRAKILKHSKDSTLRLPARFAAVQRVIEVFPRSFQAGIPVALEFDREKSFAKIVNFFDRNPEKLRQRLDGLAGTPVRTRVDCGRALRCEYVRECLSIAKSLGREWTIVPFALRTVTIQMAGYALEVDRRGVTYEQYFKWREHNLWVTRFSPNTHQRNEDC